VKNKEHSYVSLLAVNAVRINGKNEQEKAYQYQTTFFK
jgi:hypothetical protein